MPTYFDLQRDAAEALIEAQLQHHVGAEHSLLHYQSCRHELYLHRGLCGQPLQSHLEADRGVGQLHDVRRRRPVPVGVVALVDIREGNKPEAALLAGDGKVCGPAG